MKSKLNRRDSLKSLLGALGIIPLVAGAKPSPETVQKAREIAREANKVEYDPLCKFYTPETESERSWVDNDSDEG